MKRIKREKCLPFIELEDGNGKFEIWDGNSIYNFKEHKWTEFTWAVINSTRSVAKTTTMLRALIDDYHYNGRESVIFRRWDRDLTHKQYAKKLFNKCNSMGWVSQHTGGEWDTITYESGNFYLSRIDIDEDKNGEKIKKLVKAEKPFISTMTFSEINNSRGGNYDETYNILFDEFVVLKGKKYRDTEWKDFTDFLETVRRFKPWAEMRIVLLGNTHSRFCPYYSRLNLSDIRTQPIGTIDTYKTDLGIIVKTEFVPKPPHSRTGDGYNFDNGELDNMVETGGFSTEHYKTIPEEWLNQKSKGTAFVCFMHEVLQIDIIKIPKENQWAVYIHRQEREINDNKDLIYSDEWTSRPNILRSIEKATPSIPLSVFLEEAISQNRGIVFDSDLTGDTFDSYLSSLV